MSPTRLLVLGVVRMYGKAHGYQVRRELLTWSADRWANVQPGSIYHALKKMAAEGLLEAVPDEPEGRGPDRVAYRLTGDGETEFQVRLAQMLSQLGENDAQNAFGFAAALTFLTCLPRQRAASLLQHRLTQMEGQLASVRHVLGHGVEWGQPAHVNELYRLWATNVSATMEWVRNLIKRLEDGEYVMADDPGRSFGEPPR
ncbi:MULTISPECIES: PadR family transcriptional regulator [Amycolatopsis]|uniref:PadR family transcriptional regulator n=1 Tax=Amycolatopsis thermalba TaxID=944492 RepID=A0ABY4P504_9PSEU|nr:MULTISPECIES: PadR family transcriptional regulator [Amycolatopsis]OXM73271.1 PadR family transcriptional regulator [Amycolatopsis sp. KNN50.9b]UQS27271.1 PadR family transcriptional regulator [Amycolatopsis thermalba]